MEIIGGQMSFLSPEKFLFYHVATLEPSKGELGVFTWTGARYPYTKKKRNQLNLTKQIFFFILISLEFF